MVKSLHVYNKKRNFNITAEPTGETQKEKNNRPKQPLRFVIQKHDARRLHYDFRLELNGTLKSWAIPKGPSLDPKNKRLAVHVEDHPLSYATFEGAIPQGQYGGGDVIVWDQGIWRPHDDPTVAYKSGKLKFTLVGEKLSGDWTLVRTKLLGSGDKEQWLLIKEHDDSARAETEYDVVAELPESVITGQTLPSERSNMSTRSKEITNAKKKLLPATSQSLNAPSAEQKTALPQQLKPQLATLVSAPPSGDWLYEIKFDGYRILARIADGQVHLFSRNGHDWTERLPQQAEAIAALKLGDSWLDGEVVVLDDNGLPSFQALQNAFDIGSSHDIIYYLFDAPFLNGQDLQTTPVEIRRAALEKILPTDLDQDSSADQESSADQNSPLRFSAVFTADHQSMLTSACAIGLEGLIGKRLGSAYVSRRSGDWIKLKCRLRQEFVIVGYTQPQGSRAGFGALLVAVHAQPGKPELRYSGRIGTGFTQTILEDLFAKLQKLTRETSPLSHDLTTAQKQGVKWVEPKLICESEFAQWTDEGILRQAAFISLRTDKPVKDILREQAMAPTQLPSAHVAATWSSQENKLSSAGLKNRAEKKLTSRNRPTNALTITHPDRVIDPQSGATKKDLADFYNDVADWILPHLINRPVSLLRAPDGINGQQFFQKHADHLAFPNIRHLDPALDPVHAALMEIDSLEALLGTVQMGTIELHTWGATTDKIEFPDRITLDLDPDPNLPWRSVIEAVRLTLAVLDELKLDACLKTSGGKGMHIVIPLTPKAGWEEVKKFSKAISEFLAREIPERFVAKMGPQNRIGKIFVDYLRNSRGASTVSAYSIRARVGLPVSVPITRDELATLKSSSQWNITNLQERLRDLKADPWADCEKKQRITAANWKKLDAIL